MSAGDPAKTKGKGAVSKLTPTSTTGKTRQRLAAWLPSAPSASRPAPSGRPASPTAPSSATRWPVGGADQDRPADDPSHFAGGVD